MPPVPIATTERKKYAADLPALTVRWMIADDERAWENAKVHDLLLELSRQGASTRLLLLLSFVPTALFGMLKVRRSLETGRRQSNPIVERYHNPQTKTQLDARTASDRNPGATESAVERAKR